MTMCCKRIIALKFREVFLWAIPLNAIKTLSTGELCTHLFQNQKPEVEFEHNQDEIYFAYFQQRKPY